MRKWALVLLLMLYGCNQEEEKIVPVQETVKVQGIDIELISPENAMPLDIEDYYEQKKEMGYVMPREIIEMVGYYYFKLEPLCYYEGLGYSRRKKCHQGVTARICSIESDNMTNSDLAELPLDNRKVLAQERLNLLKRGVKRSAILEEGEDFFVYSITDLKTKFFAELELNGLLFTVKCREYSPTDLFHTSYWEEAQIKTWVKTLLELNRAKVENTQQ